MPLWHCFVVSFLTILCNRLVEVLLKGMSDVCGVFSSNSRILDRELKRNSAGWRGGDPLLYNEYLHPKILPIP